MSNPTTRSSVQTEPQYPLDAPTLIVGLLGFSREQELAVADFLARRLDSLVAWRTGSPAQADALWVHGARAQLLPDGSLRVAAGQPNGRSVRLSLQDVQRPVAFSEPLASREIEPACSFDIDDPASVSAVLTLMEDKWLAPLAARLWLAGYLVEKNESLAHRVYHLVRGGRLLAVVDRTGDAGIAPDVALEDLEQATWLPRPSTAAFVPPSFQPRSISELVWIYAGRTQVDLLPARYRERPIYFRRTPKVPQRLLGDDHLLLIRELLAGPLHFPELQQRTGMGDEALARSLAALYLAGSITCNPMRVLDQRAVAAGTVAESVWSPTRSSSQFAPGAAAQGRDFTIPANLPR